MTGRSTVCPRQHPLMPITTSEAGYKCDGCGAMQGIGIVMWECTACDYDMCNLCYHPPVTVNAFGALMNARKAKPTDSGAGGKIQVSPKTVSGKETVSGNGKSSSKSKSSTPKSKRSKPYSDEDILEVSKSKPAKSTKKATEKEAKPTAKRKASPKKKPIIDISSASETDTPSLPTSETPKQTEVEQRRQSGRIKSKEVVLIDDSPELSVVRSDKTTIVLRRTRSGDVHPFFKPGSKPISTGKGSSPASKKAKKIEAKDSPTEKSKKSKKEAKDPSPSPSPKARSEVALDAPIHNIYAGLKKASFFMNEAERRLERKATREQALSVSLEQDLMRDKQRMKELGVGKASAFYEPRRPAPKKVSTVVSLALVDLEPPLFPATAHIGFTDTTSSSLALPSSSVRCRIVSFSLEVLSAPPSSSSSSSFPKSLSSSYFSTSQKSVLPEPHIDKGESVEAADITCFLETPRVKSLLASIGVLFPSFTSKFITKHYRRTLLHRVQCLKTERMLEAQRNTGVSQAELDDREQRRKRRLLVKDEEFELRAGQTDSFEKVEEGEHAGMSALWTEKYRAFSPKEIIGNEVVINQISDWLRQFSTKAEVRQQKEQYWDSDDEFNVYEEPEEEDGAVNSVLLVGPVGVGKTLSVYTIAQATGYKILEINSSQSRSGSELLNSCGEAMQSHRLNLGDTKKKMLALTKKDPFAKKRKTQPKQEEAKVPSGPKSSTLMLFEEVDCVFESDLGFHRGLNALMKGAKRPIVLTCNTTPDWYNPKHTHRFEFQQLSTSFVVLRLLLIMLSEVGFINSDDLTRLVIELTELAQCFGQDLRRCLLNLQLWIQPSPLPSIIQQTCKPRETPWFRETFVKKTSKPDSRHVPLLFNMMGLNGVYGVLVALFSCDLRRSSPASSLNSLSSCASSYSCSISVSSASMSIACSVSSSSSSASVPSSSLLSLPSAIPSSSCSSSNVIDLSELKASPKVLPATVSPSSIIDLTTASAPPHSNGFHSPNLEEDIHALTFSHEAGCSVVHFNFLQNISSESFSTPSPALITTTALVPLLVPPHVIQPPFEVAPVLPSAAKKKRGVTKRQYQHRFPLTLSDLLREREVPAPTQPMLVEDSTTDISDFDDDDDFEIAPQPIEATTRQITSSAQRKKKIVIEDEALSEPMNSLADFEIDSATSGPVLAEGSLSLSSSSDQAISCSNHVSSSTTSSLSTSVLPSSVVAHPDSEPITSKNELVSSSLLATSAPKEELFEGTRDSVSDDGDNDDNKTPRKRRRRRLKSGRRSVSSQMYEVDSIIECRGEDETKEYRVRWKGFSQDYDTWEPECHLRLLDVFVEFQKSRGLLPISAVFDDSLPEPLSSVSVDSSSLPASSSSSGALETSSVTSEPSSSSYSSSSSTSLESSLSSSPKLHTLPTPSPLLSPLPVSSPIPLPEPLPEVEVLLPVERVTACVSSAPPKPSASALAVLDLLESMSSCADVVSSVDLWTLPHAPGHAVSVFSATKRAYDGMRGFLWGSTREPEMGVDYFRGVGGIMGEGRTDMDWQHEAAMGENDKEVTAALDVGTAALLTATQRDSFSLAACAEALALRNLQRFRSSSSPSPLQVVFPFVSEDFRRKCINLHTELWEGLAIEPYTCASDEFVLDYVPVLECMCRDEELRRQTSGIRARRFRHYLGTWLSERGIALLLNKEKFDNQQQMELEKQEVW